MRPVQPAIPMYCFRASEAFVGSLLQSAVVKRYATTTSHPIHAIAGGLRGTAR